jgi:cytochrome o ubiquinol oxidase subunit 2
MKRTRVVLIGLVVLVAVIAFVRYLMTTKIAVLDPKGTIALQEKNLIVFALLLSLIVVIPVFALLFVFAWRYREGNDKAKYSPNLDHNVVAETIWWLVPTALISVLAVVAWNSSHSLDPYKPLVSSVAPVTIQVVALDWKWLFIYPQDHVATVNYVRIPDKTPVNFVITADAPMNSFWIPQLGGQIYAMPGMSTQLHLAADAPGSYNGSSANISGVGFSGMTFVAQSSSMSDYKTWLADAQRSPQRLTAYEYNQLAKPSQNNTVATYSDVVTGLYEGVLDKYVPAGTMMGGMMQ